jgi:FkbM family methyltransferase
MPPERRALARFRAFCAQLPDRVADPFFVKVGANDGVSGDPCSDILLADARWRGLLIEPVPYSFERLQAAFGDSRRFVLERTAVGDTEGTAVFYYVDPKARDAAPDLPFWFDQLGSFDARHILKHLDGRLQPFIVECEVAVKPLGQVLASHGIRDVHLLHIDTEGYDYEILKTVDLMIHPPVAIFIEHKHLAESQRRDMHQRLTMHGYAVRDCGGDYFALNRQAETRLSRVARRHG